MAEEGLTPDEQLNAENEILRLKLQMEHGMSGMGSKLPPEIENAWLKNISEFEKQHAENKTIKVYDKVGRPFFKPVTELKKEEMTIELNRMEEILQAHGISLDVLAQYPDELIYQFITEELFEQETDDISIPGFMTCFIYEEFHPNHRYDLEQRTNDCILDIFTKRESEEYIFFTAEDTIIYNGREYDKKDLATALYNFQQLFEAMEIKSLAIQDIYINSEETSGMVTAHVELELTHKDGSIEIQKHNPVFNFILSYEWWSFCGAEVEGLRI